MKIYYIVKLNGFNNNISIGLMNLSLILLSCRYLFVDILLLFIREFTVADRCAGIILSTVLTGISISANSTCRKMRLISMQRSHFFGEDALENFRFRLHFFPWNNNSNASRGYTFVCSQSSPSNFVSPTLESQFRTNPLLKHQPTLPL